MIVPARICITIIATMQLLYGLGWLLLGIVLLELQLLWTGQSSPVFYILIPLLAICLIASAIALFFSIQLARRLSLGLQGIVILLSLWAVWSVPNLDRNLQQFLVVNAVFAAVLFLFLKISPVQPARSST